MSSELPRNSTSIDSVRMKIKHREVRDIRKDLVDEFIVQFISDSCCYLKSLMYMSFSSIAFMSSCQQRKQTF